MGCDTQNLFGIKLRSDSVATAQKLGPTRILHIGPSRFNLVAHHAECTIPFLLLHWTKPPGTKLLSDDFSAMPYAGLPATKQATAIENKCLKAEPHNARHSGPFEATEERKMAPAAAAC